MMGSPETEESHLDPEEPQHLVTFAQTIRGWRLCRRFRMNGMLAWRTAPATAIAVRSRLGPWPPSGHQCFLGRREGLCAMAVAQDGKDVPAAERSRTRNMRRGQERPRRSGGAVRSRRSKRITTGTLCTVGGPKGEYRQRTSPVDPSSQIPGVSTRCTAMYWNGRRIVRTITTMETVRRLGLDFPEIAVVVPFAAVPGTSLRISLARPSAWRLYSVNRTSTQSFRVGRTLKPGESGEGIMRR